MIATRAIRLLIGLLIESLYHRTSKKGDACRLSPRQGLIENSIDKARARGKYRLGPGPGCVSILGAVLNANDDEGAPACRRRPARGQAPGRGHPKRPNYLNHPHT